MFERISRGWGIAKASGAVLKRHPSLVLLPIFSCVACLLLLAVVGGFVYAGTGAEPLNEVSASFDRYSNGSPIVYVVLFVIYLVTSFVATFFNAALVSCALDAFDGRTPTVRGGLAAALRRLPQITAWSVVAATVGLLLNIVQSFVRDKLGFLGALLGGLMDAAWSVVTYFVVPVLVVEGAGPIKAVKRSASILKQTWGESLGGEGGLGLVSFLFFLPALLLVPVVYLAADLPVAVLVVVIAVFVAYLLVVSLIFAALGTIFRAGAYLYGTTGHAPSSIDPALLQSAFHTKV